MCVEEEEEDIDPPVAISFKDPVVRNLLHDFNMCMEEDIQNDELPAVPTVITGMNRTHLHSTPTTLKHQYSEHMAIL